MIKSSGKVKFKFMTRYISFILIISSIILTSCTYFSGEKSIIYNREAEYLKARSIPPLKIPPGLSSSTIETHYPISDKEYPESSKRVDLTPPELNQ